MKATWRYSRLMRSHPHMRGRAGEAYRMRVLWKALGERLLRAGPTPLWQGIDEMPTIYTSQADGPQRGGYAAAQAHEDACR